MTASRLLRTSGGRGAIAAVALAAAIVVVTLAAPGLLLPGIAVSGVSVGLLNALGAIGIIVTFRGGRYVNFAQGAIGAAGADIAYRLIALRGYNFLLGILIGLVVAVLIAALCELIFVQLLFKATRLVLTIATLGISLLAPSIESFFDAVITPKGAQIIFFLPGIPFQLSFNVGAVTISTPFVLVLIVVPVVVVGLALFFQRSRHGMVIEASAQNADRARLVGISVRGLSTVTWMLIGFLGGLFALFDAQIIGSEGVSLGPELLLLALAPAMIAGLESIWLAVGAAIVLGIVQQDLFYQPLTSGSPGLIYLVTLLAILGALVVRRRKLGVGGRIYEPPLTLGLALRPFPRELSRDRLLAAARVAGRLGVVAAAILVPIALNATSRQDCSLVLVYILAALSLTVLTGYAGQISFGQYALVGVGALLGDYLATAHHLNFWAGLVLLPLAGAVIATLIGIPALQIRGIFLGVTTLGFAVAASDYFFGLSWFSAPGVVTAPTILGVDLGTSPLAYYYFALVVTAVVFLAIGRLRKSALGRNMAAARDNSQVATAYGISVLWTRLVAFTLSGLVAALAGYLYLYTIQQPNVTTFIPSISLSLFAAVVVGGVSTRMGAVIAGLYVQGLESFVPNAGVQLLTTSLGLLLVLIFIPQGLSGVVIDVRDALLRAYAGRGGIGLSSARSGTEAVDAIAAEAMARSEGPEVPAGLAPTRGTTA